jgi:hypothetical protein
MPSQPGSQAALFSFVDSLFQSSDQGLITRDLLQTLFQQWGNTIGAQMEWTGSLADDLEQIAKTLHSLGLVRVFEPLNTQADKPQILVMRCLFSRYISSPRLAKQLPHFRIVPSLVNGLLDAAGHSFQVTEQPGPALRQDEYILALELATRSQPGPLISDSIEPKGFQFIDLIEAPNTPGANE